MKYPLKYLIPFIIVLPLVTWFQTKTPKKIELQTPSAYISGIVIEKYIDSINYVRPCYRMTIKRAEWHYNGGYNEWTIFKINVTEYEYNLYNIRDTIK